MIAANPQISYRLTVFFSKAVKQARYIYRADFGPSIELIRGIIEGRLRCSIQIFCKHSPWYMASLRDG